MKTTTITAMLFSVVLLFSACDSDDDNNNDINDDYAPEADGIGYVQTTEAANSVYDAVISILNGNENIGIVAEVDHSSNAQSVGMTLDYTRTVYFGNPTLGTPLMQDNIRAGLDLPQRIIVYTNANNETVVAYTDVDYVVYRHNLGAVSTTETIESALENIVTTATGEETVMFNGLDTDDGTGIIDVLSENDFNTTYSNITTMLNSLEPISIMAELDHQANANSVGMELMPSKLIIFGNPSLGTPLMQDSRSAALDLPQKMLVYQNEDDEVHIIYNDPYYIAERDDIDDDLESLSLISQALDNIATTAAAEQ